MPRTTQQPGFSHFRARGAKTRKSCTWCGARVSLGVTIRRGEHIAGLCCYTCFAALTAWLSKELQKTLANFSNISERKGSGDGY